MPDTVIRIEQTDMAMLAAAFAPAIERLDAIAGMLQAVLARLDAPYVVDAEAAPQTVTQPVQCEAWFDVPPEALPASLFQTTPAAGHSGPLAAMPAMTPAFPPGAPMPAYTAPETAERGILAIPDDSASPPPPAPEALAPTVETPPPAAHAAPPEPVDAFPGIPGAGNAAEPLAPPASPVVADVPIQPAPLPRRTPERRAILERDWPAGVPWRWIVAKLAELPGGKLEPDQRTYHWMKSWANDLGLDRPAAPVAPPGLPVNKVNKPSARAPEDVPAAAQPAPFRITAPPPKPAPAPQKPPAPASETRKWSPPRMDILTAAFPTGTAVEVILERVNALPGPALTRTDILSMAALSKLSRPNVQPPLRTAASAPEEATWTQISLWADKRRMKFDGDMKPINDRRAAMGLPPFTLVEPFGPGSTPHSVGNGAPA